MDPKPLEYEPAHRKLSGLKWIVMVILLAGSLLLAAVYFGALSRVQFTATGSVQFTAPVSAATQPAGTVVLPFDPTEYHTKQRSSFQFPGNGQTPTVAIGDVTGGQVMVHVTHANGGLLYAQSMKPGDVATIINGQQTLHLQLVRLHNSLTQDDRVTLSVTATRPVSEAVKIDALIAHIETLDGAQFYRNGEWHAARDAAAHLRRKRDHAGDKLKTAEQFIEELATKSSSSGEAYRIRLKDGTEKPSGDYLRDKLSAIEKALQSK